uniref:CRISPR-associated exonuclease Cas4 n=1 Tax=Fervidicoccus fontis TaxID=683846 RepID=A0A7J3ZM25_9CREN
MSCFITRLLYERKRQEFLERVEELKDENTIYVTELISCPQKRVYRISFPELTFKFDPHLLLGEMAHVGLQSYLSQAGFEVEKEIEEGVEVEGRVFKVKGRIDAYSENLIVEIKTGRPGQRLPQAHHVLQTKIYLLMTGAQRGILVYLTSDRLVEYQVDYDESLELGSLVVEYLREGKIPRWEWECRYCVFNKICPYTVSQQATPKG